MNRNIAREKKGLSPVIATVILISVTIVVAVSVAYWMGSIASGYTTFEQIELPTVYAEYNDEAEAWNVTIELKNTGSADATIDNIFLNSIPLKDYGDNITLYCDTNGDGTIENSSLSTIEIRINKGSSEMIILEIKGNNAVEGCTAGTRVDIKLHSVAGREYPAQVKLP